MPTYYSNFQYLSEAVEYSSIMKACYDTISRKHYTFRVPESQVDLVKNFMPQFKLGALKTIQQITRVAFTRLVDIDVRQNVS